MNFVAARKKILFAGMSGNILEWYDFSIYGYLAATLGTLFFPAQNATTSLLQIFSVFALGYLARPLGGFIFGQLGDKYGRSKALRFSMYAMGIATCGMGVLPTYHQAGIAPTIILILLRIIQGISAGGELVASTVYIYEIAPEKSQTFWCSCVTFSCTVGALMGSLVIGFLYHQLTADQILQWGWRIPYFCGLLLCGFSLWSRRNLMETSIFKKTALTMDNHKFPVTLALKKSHKPIMQVVTLNVFIAISFYTFFVWMPSFLHFHLQMLTTQALFINTTAMVLLVILTPLMGLLADRYGRKRIAILSPLLIAVLSYPIFWCIVHGSYSTILFALLIFAVAFSFIEGTTAAITASIFPADHRTSGIGLSYNISMSLFGGTAPLICTYLFAQTSSTLIPSLYIMASALIGAFTIFSIKSEKCSSQ